MARGSYQTYTSETPISAFREDFIHREAICVALAKRHPELAPIAAEAREVVTGIDGRRAALEKAEDDSIRARAVESAQKLEALDVYATLRGLVGVYDKDDVFAFLPDPPSALQRLRVTDLRSRVTTAIDGLRKLPDGENRYAELLAALETALAELATADVAEDSVRSQLRAVRLGLMVYRGELAAVRDAQLGAIQAILTDRSRVSLFTLPWRKRRASRAADEELETDAPVEAEPA